MNSNILPIFGNILMFGFAIFGSYYVGTTMDARRSAESALIKTTETVKNIEAIYWHEHLRYSYYMRTPNGIEVFPLLENTPVASDNTKIIFHDTLKDEESIYFIRTFNKAGRVGLVDVFIHKINELNGAAWSHGKFGHGTTVRIANSTSK